MKLFHKILLLLFASAIIPLLAYFFLLFSTTAVTLKNTINENNVNYLVSMSAEVDRFFANIENILDIGRFMEAQKQTSSQQVTSLMFNRVMSSPLSAGVFLVGEDGQSLRGVCSENAVFTGAVNPSLMQKTGHSRQVEIGDIYYTNSVPYFDVVYPVDVTPRQYLYVQVSLKKLMSTLENRQKREYKVPTRTFTIIDSRGNAVSTAPGTVFGNDVHALDAAQLDDLKRAPLATAFLYRKNVTAVTKTRDSEWYMVLQEPEKIAYAPVSRMRLGALSLLCFVIVITTIGTTTLARSVSNRVTALMAGIKSVGSGDLDHRIQTDRRQSSDEMEKLKIEFNTMTERIKQLQEEVKRHERLSAIGKMSSVVGNEMNKLINGTISASVSLKEEVAVLLVGNAASKAPAYLILLEHANASMQKLVRDLLDYAREQPPSIAPCDLNDLIRELVEEIEISDEIELTLELGQVPPVAVDRDEIKQVIRNVAGNAIDSMDEKSIKDLTIRTRVSSSGTERQSVALDISDTGCGIPPENIPKITDPFFSTKSRGTGLGMAIVEKIMRQRHKGDFEIKSRLGEGTTVTLLFQA